MNDCLLQQLATTTNGRYADAQLTDEDINFLLDESIFNENENLVDVEREFDIWYETGPWLLLLALPIAALAFRRGWLLSITLAVIFMPERPVYAWELKDLWVNKDVQGSEAFVEEEYSEAATLFKDEAWRAAANYRTGNFENALADLNILEDVESHYNRGNSLARLNRFPEAIEAYNQVLDLTPEHEDAKFNKELLEQVIEEQEQQENSESEDQDQDQQESDQQQDQQNQEQQSEESEQEQQQKQEEQSQDQQQSDEESESDPQEQKMPEPEEGEQPDTEEEQAMEQWLRRIPDDPGELLRRKFQYQAARRRFEEIQNPSLLEQQENDDTW